MNEEPEKPERDAAAFANQTPSWLQHAPPAEVQFQGVISADPRFQHATVPPAHQSHELVKGRFFYTVPWQLLESVCRPQAGERFHVDADLLKLESDLSRISGDHGQRVGFRDNSPITCNLMPATPLRKEDLEPFSEQYDEEKLNEIVRKANERLLSFSQTACGFAGWLMTNPGFLAELRELETSHHDQMLRWGTDLVGVPIPSTVPAGRFNPTGEEGWSEYESAVLDFCVRWRLLGLAGPRIPVPMRPMMSGQIPMSIVPQLLRAGGVFNWPDTFPLLSRDELRDLLAQALAPTAGAADHLAPWHEIVSSTNRAKNSIPAFERRFRLQHFWRLLRERHPHAFARRLQRIEDAFAKYFGTTSATVRSDRKTIEKSLGKGWDQPDEAPSCAARPPR